MSSNGYNSFLAVTCMIAVKNDIGLKRPEIQRDLGVTKSDDHYYS